jgi:hypothetical protein
MDCFEGTQTNPLSLHKYCYANANAMNMVDPAGHEGDFVSLTATMSLMYSLTTFELRGANGVLKGATALFGGDQNVNDLIHGMDIINIVDENVGWVALGAGAIAGGFKVLEMFQSFLGGSAAKRIAEKALTTLQKLAPAAENLCFVAGTLVSTERGPVPIESVSPGSHVWSWDEVNGAFILQVVANVTNHLANEIAEIHLADCTIEATPQHPFWVADKGWVQARDLQVGDRLHTMDGEVAIVTGTGLCTSGARVFNFEVEGTHTYLVGEHPVVVHNTCPWGQRASTIPKGVPGIYVIKTPNGETYVGQAIDLFGRLTAANHSHADLIRDPANQLYTIQVDLANWNGSTVDAIDIVEEFFIRALGAKWSPGNPNGLNRRFEVNPEAYKQMIRLLGFPDMAPPVGH